MRRIWRRDGTLWAPEGTPELTDRLGWLDIAEKMARARRRPRGASPRRCASAGYTDAVLLGMGGSSLAPEVFRRSFGRRRRAAPARARLDAPGPGRRRWSTRSTSSSTLFIVSSKSGGTIETMSQFKFFHARQGDGAHFVAVTDPGTSLAKLGAEHGFRRVFENDPEIGGRYSALSYFGLVPAALIGRRRRRGARHRAGRRWRTASCEDGNAGPVARRRARRAGPARARQADVRGRRAARVLRAVGRAADRRVDRQAGPRHPADRRRAAGRPRRLRPRPRVPAPRRPATRPRPRRSAALRAAGHPTITVHADGPGRPRARSSSYSEFATAVAGWALGHQPVRPAQRAGGQGQHARACSTRARRSSTRATSTTLLGGLAPPRYVAIMAYLPYSRRDRRGASRGCASGSSPSTASRPRSATARASCTRPASSTRAARRSARSSQIVDEPGDRPRGARRAVHVRAR